MKRTMTGLLLVCLPALLLGAGCGDDDGTPPAGDGPLPIDSGDITVDAAVPDAPADAPVGPDAPPAADAATNQPVGAACGANAECAGGYCIDEGMGFPGGYCTHIGCDLTMPDTTCAPFGGDSICLDSGSGLGVCVDLCDPAAPDCRAAYECVPLGDGRGICLPAPVCGNGTVERGEECEPPGTTTCDANCHGLGAAPIGDPCTSAGDCSGDYCIDTWPGGYCSQLACDLTMPDTSCLGYGGDGLCVDVGDPGAPYGACFDRCDPAMMGADCRAGYMCQGFGGTGVCVAAPFCGDGVVNYPEECEPPGTATCDAMCIGTGTAPVGSACATAADCAGNWCLTDADGYPGGYCTQVGCDLTAPTTSCLAYGGDGYCVDSGGTGVCVDTCTPGGGGGCRAGYTCTMAGGGLRFCVP